MRKRRLIRSLNGSIKSASSHTKGFFGCSGSGPVSSPRGSLRQEIHAKTLASCYSFCGMIRSIVCAGAGEMRDEELDNTSLRNEITNMSNRNVTEQSKAKS